MTEELPEVRSAGTTNTSLHAAKRAKNDEFYTQLTDIEKEMCEYKDHFKGKVVFCNCDDPEWSNFYKYFTLNFEHLKLAKVVTTHYANNEPSYKLEYFGADTPPVKTALEGDGDFRSEECVAILKEADIVVTNPPFSLFRDYVEQLMEHGKSFIIIGNKNAITYKSIFESIKENKIWAGYRNINSDMWFILPDDCEKWEKVIDGKKVQHIMGCWFTNLPHKKRNEEMVLFKKYVGNEAAYPKYDNYDAIEVSKVTDIPCDYAGCMGVPITFLDKYNPSQFEIIGCSYSYGEPVGYHNEGETFNCIIAGKQIYKRLFILKKQDNPEL